MTRPVVATTRAPHLRDSLSVVRAEAIILAAALAVAAAVVAAAADPAAAALRLAAVFAVAVLAAEAVARGFARLRRRATDPGAASAAAIFALLAPAEAPLWMAAVAMAFGIGFGREVFGGFGRNFIHPAVAAAVFLFVAWPAAAGGAVAIAGDGAIWGIGAAAVLLLGRGIAAWRVIAGTALGAGLAAAVAGGLEGSAAGPAIAFGAVFLAADPVTAAATRPGRWIGGAVFGGLAVAIAIANPAAAAPMLFAVVLTNVVTPTVDVVVIAANARRRARRSQ